MLTIGSLFSGIGGLELGLEWAGLGPVKWQCEIDPFCRAVLAKHWPGVTRYEDVTARRDWPYVDIVCGGFPCQDVSQASRGRGGGLGGQRSGLWYHFAAVVETCAAPFVVVENVQSGVQRWLPAVRRQLCNLGYRTRALGITARDVGAPHTRARVFVIGYADGNRKSALPVNDEAPDLPSASRAMWCRGWPPAPQRLRVDDGLPNGLDRDHALGNAVVPQCAHVVGEVIKRMITTTKEMDHAD
jgi:DNA (cytosine-5)-methyltransferase 1